MGAETSTTHLIFFIVSIIIATSVVAVIFANVNSVSNASYIAGNTLSKQLQTDIVIINDPNNIPKSGNVHTFYVKNIGRSTLTTEFVSILINGVYIDDSNVEKIVIGGGNTTTWRTTEVLQLNVTDVNIPYGDNNIRVITENGVDDSLKFIK